MVLNRVAHPAYPASVCGVVFQGSERTTGCQFSFTCDGSLVAGPRARGWAVAQSVALAALAGEVYRPIGLATHYHTHYVNPYWAASLDFIRSIGAHRFYRWRGGAGTAGAFTDAYAGSEPLAAPNVARAEASNTRPRRSAARQCGPGSAPRLSLRSARRPVQRSKPRGKAAAIGPRARGICQFGSLDRGAGQVRLREARAQTFTIAQPYRGTKA